eukprot:764574-Hanusia_phi.AAC.5
MAVGGGVRASLVDPVAIVASPDPGVTVEAVEALHELGEDRAVKKREHFGCLFATPIHHRYMHPVSHPLLWPKAYPSGHLLYRMDFRYQEGWCPAAINWGVVKSGQKKLTDGE